MKYFPIILLFSLFIKTEQETLLIGQYNGYWATTRWTIDIKSNNEFDFITSGHFGFTKTTGKYYLSKSIVQLKADNDAILSSVFESLKLKRVNDSCLVDLSNGYDYCRNRTDYWCSRKWNLKNWKIIEDCP